MRDKNRVMARPSDGKTVCLEIKSCCVVSSEKERKKTHIKCDAESSCAARFPLCYCCSPVPPSSFPPIPSIFYSKSSGFQYVNRGSMSSAGIGDGLVDMTRIARPGKDGRPAGMRGPALTGPMAFTAWHGYYFSKQYQSLNVVLNVVQSLKSRLFRRDTHRIRDLLWGKRQPTLRLGYWRGC